MTPIFSPERKTGGLRLGLVPKGKFRSFPFDLISLDGEWGKRFARLYPHDNI